MISGRPRSCEQADRRWSPGRWGGIESSGLAGRNPRQNGSSRRGTQNQLWVKRWVYDSDTSCTRVGVTVLNPGTVLPRANSQRKALVAVAEEVAAGEQVAGIAAPKWWSIFAIRLSTLLLKGSLTCTTSVADCRDHRPAVPGHAQGLRCQQVCDYRVDRPTVRHEVINLRLGRHSFDVGQSAYSPAALHRAKEPERLVLHHRPA